MLLRGEKLKGTEETGSFLLERGAMLWLLSTRGYICLFLPASLFVAKDAIDF